MSKWVHSRKQLKRSMKIAAKFWSDYDGEWARGYSAAATDNLADLKGTWASLSRKQILKEIESLIDLFNGSRPYDRGYTAALNDLKADLKLKRSDYEQVDQ